MSNRIAIPALLAVSLSGCCAHYVPRFDVMPGGLEEAAASLDKMKWYADAYGGATVSSPILVQPDDTFKFNLTQVSPDTFFASEKNDITGKVATVSSSANVSGASVSASWDIAATQQYLAGLSAYRQSQAASSQKNQMQNEAAIQAYRAALIAADSISDPAKRSSARADALNTLSQSITQPSAAYPSEGTPPSLPTTTQAANQAAQLLLPFAGPQSLYSAGTPPVVGDTRTALLMAAGDTATYAMLSLLGDPTKISKYKDKRAVFGTSMVSVNPGWRTRHGYVADITMHFAFEAAVARPAVRQAFLQLKGDSPEQSAALKQLQSCVADSLSLPIPDGITRREPLPDAVNRASFAPYIFNSGSPLEAPLVSAVSPMGDTQSLDVQTSLRRQSESSMQVALALYYAGLAVQADAFRDYAKQLQKDMEVRTNNVIVSPYSIGGGAFGFRIYPRVDGAAAAGDAEQSTLSVPSFPALMIIAMDDEALRPRVAVRSVGNNLQCVVVEPQLEMFERTRWIPLKEPCLHHATAEGCLGTMPTEVERFRASQELSTNIEIAKVKSWVHQSKCPEPCYSAPTDACLTQTRASIACDNAKPTLLEMTKQQEIFAEQINGLTRELWLPVETFQAAPATPHPTADVIAPSELEVERDASGNVEPKVVQMLVAGADLDQIDVTKVTSLIGSIKWLKSTTVGDVQTSPNVKAVGKALQLLFQVESGDPVVFNLPVKNSSDTVHTRPLVVRFAKDRMIETTTGTKAGVSTTRRQYSPGVSDSVIRSEIEKDKQHYPGTADVNVHVDATEKK